MYYFRNVEFNVYQENHAYNLRICCALQLHFSISPCSLGLLTCISTMAFMSWCQFTQWGRVMYICISKLTIIGSDNDFLPSWRQAIIWTNAWILLNRTLGTNLNETISKIHTFSFKKMHLKMLSGKCQPFCLGLNVSSNTEEYWYMSPRNPWKSLSTFYILWLLLSL